MEHKEPVMGSLHTPYGETLRETSVSTRDGLFICLLMGFIKKNKFMKIYKKILIFALLALFLFNSRNVLAFNNCTQVGNTSFCDDGTYYSQVGNTVYGSNGTSYSQMGNTISQDTCPYNSTLDYVSQKCKCNSGYESNGTSCVYKPTYILNPTNPSVYSSPNAPAIKPVVLPKTNNQICQSSFGVNSNWDGTKDSNGKLNCGCKTGYLWNDQAKSCVVAPAKTNDQVCSDKFGQSWKWDGSKNSEGVLNCGCINGYTQINGECTASPIIPVKTNDQICIEDYGINSTWSGKLNEKNGPICDCKINYVWNKGGTTCLAIPKTETKTIAPVIKKVLEVKENITITKPSTTDKVVITNTEEVKPKGFWTRLIGWLVF